MSVITETALRALLKNNKEQEIVISKSDIVTPSARAFINERKLSLIYKEDKQQGEVVEYKKEAEEKRFTPKYEYIGGGVYDEKPEYMTQLYDNKLVYKDHNLIVFRGKVDSFQSKILEVQIAAVKAKKESLALELEGILKVMREIMRAEVLNEELVEEEIIGLSSDELRNISHNPKKYFNRDHINIDYQMGELVILVNSLRSSVREVEIVAAKAFKGENGEVRRQDILKCLNRLSSGFYIIMHRLLSNEYK